ncbi:hypothetical protein [Streptomyces anthocyanicus]
MEGLAWLSWTGAGPAVLPGQGSPDGDTFEETASTAQNARR